MFGHVFTLSTILSWTFLWLNCQKYFVKYSCLSSFLCKTDFKIILTSLNECLNKSKTKYSLHANPLNINYYLSLICNQHLKEISWKCQAIEHCCFNYFEFYKKHTRILSSMGSVSSSERKYCLSWKIFLENIMLDRLLGNYTVLTSKPNIN